MKYSKRSLHFAWISVILLSVFLILSQLNRDNSTQFDMIIAYLITFQYMSILIGFTCSVLSLREEKTKRQKIAFWINILLFIGLASFFIFQYYTRTT
ncbi:hypothetical protein FNJ87_09610 [Nonlabens mediterrranea]|uniref:Uncharacterized protein n=1 Tax=Nonlabens mediterrranea TaxID=1419947 RepID=A0ABS0A5C1_9FLAO|nr:hypothetical protein [Nonlabens mediterrranea]